MPPGSQQLGDQFRRRLAHFLQVKGHQMPHEGRQRQAIKVGKEHIHHLKHVVVAVGLAQGLVGRRRDGHRLVREGVRSPKGSHCAWAAE